MDEVERHVIYKGKKTKMTLRKEGDTEVKGYVHGETHVVTITVDATTIGESFCDEQLEYDADDAMDKVQVAVDADADADDDADDADDDDDTDDADDADDDADDADAEVEEDQDPDYGEAVVPAGIAAVPTLHSVMAVYGKDIDVESDVRSLRGLLRTLQENEIVNVSELLLHGEGATGQGVLDAIEAIDPGKDDIVWFVYSGHGCMDGDERLFCTRGKLLRRAAVVKAVTAKKARLRVVLSDCCSSDSGKIEADEKMGGARPQLSAPNLRTLFRDYAGVFDVTSSSTYQYSFSGVFTATFIDTVLLGNTPDTWQAVFDKTQSTVMAMADGALPKDMKKKMKSEGLTVEDHQKPVAFSIPEPS